MDSNVIVMIVMLALPSAESGVHVKTYPSTNDCLEAASLVAADPFVRHVECSQLDDGFLTLKFERLDSTSKVRDVAASRQPG